MVRAFSILISFTQSPYLVSMKKLKYGMGRSIKQAIDQYIYKNRRAN